MNPRVYNEAFLMSRDSFPALLQRLVIRSFHSFLGISIAAMEAIAAATYVLTTDEGVARLKRIACLICSLKVGSNFTHISSYLAS
jgi:hypothetical protein